MELLKNEQKLFKGGADTLFLNTFRKRTVTLILTNQRVIIRQLLYSDKYLLEDITLVERFKVMFMNIGIILNLKDGKKVSLATLHIEKIVEQMKILGKM